MHTERYEARFPLVWIWLNALVAICTTYIAFIWVKQCHGQIEGSKCTPCAAYLILIHNADIVGMWIGH